MPKTTTRQERAQLDALVRWALRMTPVTARELMRREARLGIYGIAQVRSSLGRLEAVGEVAVDRVAPHGRVVKTYRRTRVCG